MNRLIQLFLVLIVSPLILSERIVFTDTGISSAQWSPSGKNILYTQGHDQSRELYLINADGSNPLQLTHGELNESVQWSPDGSLIAYTRIDVTDSSFRHALHLMNADGSQDRPLLESTDFFLNSTWSPDGSKILVWSDKQLFTINPDGSNLALIASGDVVGGGYAWSPDGGQIAFLDRNGSAMWVMNADGSDIKHLFTRPYLSGPAWSPNGQKIGFQYHEGTPYSEGTKIGVINADGTGFSTLISNLTGYTRGFGWSPDSTKIAYSNFSEIYVISVDGGPQIRLTNSQSQETMPTWSPDGSKIAYITYMDEGLEIFEMDANGANPIRVTFNEYDEQEIAWSPDSARILSVGSQQPYTSLSIISGKGGAPRVLSARLNVVSFAISPNEKKIAFTQYLLPNVDLFLVNPDGSNLIKLPTNGQVSAFAWSHDGQRLAFSTAQKGLYVINANATEVTDLSRISTKELTGPLQWSSDGSSFAYEENGDIYLLDAVNGAITQLTTDGIYTQPKWSPTAPTLIFFGTTSQPALFTYSVAVGSVTKLNDAWGEKPGLLQWSPDGSKILYSTTSESSGLPLSSGTDSDVPLPMPPPPPVYTRTYVINADSSDPILIDDADYNTRWIPDNHWLQIFSGNGSFLMRPDGSERISFPNGGEWSPDSRQLLYLSSDGEGLYPNTSIYIGRRNF